MDAKISKVHYVGAVLLCLFLSTALCAVSAHSASPFIRNRDGKPIASVFSGIVSRADHFVSKHRNASCDSSEPQLLLVGMTRASVVPTGDCSGHYAVFEEYYCCSGSNYSFGHTDGNAGYCGGWTAGASVCGGACTSDRSCTPADCVE